MPYHTQDHSYRQAALVSKRFISVRVSHILLAILKLLLDVADSIGDDLLLQGGGNTNVRIERPIGLIRNNFLLFYIIIYSRKLLLYSPGSPHLEGSEKVPRARPGC